MLGEYEVELVAIVFGSVMAFVLLLLGCNRREITRSDSLCVVIGSLDFASDVLFARLALLTSPTPALAYLPMVFVAGPFVLSTFPLLLIVAKNRDLIDMDTFARHPSFYACMLVLALTNLEVLKLIPWRETRYDGFPSSRLLALTFFTTAFEDIPQTVLQVAYLIAMGRGDAIAIISLGFSLCSIWVRGFRKLIIILFVRPEHGAGTLSSRSGSFLMGGASWRRRSSAYPPPPGMGALSPGSGTRLRGRSLSMPIGSARLATPRLRTNTDDFDSPAVPMAVPPLAIPTSRHAAGNDAAAAGVYGWCARRLGRFSFAGRRAQAQPTKATPQRVHGLSRRTSSIGSDAPCLWSPRLSPRDSFASAMSSRRRSLSGAFDGCEEEGAVTIASPRASTARRASLPAVCDSPRASAGDGAASVAVVSRNLDDVKLHLGEKEFARLEAQLDPTMRADLRRRDSAASFLAASVAARAAATAADAKRAPPAPARVASFGLRRGGSLSLQKRTAQRRRGSSVGSALVEPTATAAPAAAAAPAGESGAAYAEKLRADPRIMPLADLRRTSSGGGRGSSSSSNKRSGSRCGSGSDVLSELSSLLSDDGDDDDEREAAERRAVAAAIAMAAARPPIDLCDVDATLRGGAAALQRARAARAARSHSQPHARALAPEVAPSGAGLVEGDDDDWTMQT